MLIEQRLEFIDSLPQIAVPQRSFFNAPAAAAPVHNVDKPTATVLPGTIDAYLPGISQDIIDDVDLCKLVMQNAASKKFPEEDRLSDWYRFYVNGLFNLGWVMQNKDMHETTVRGFGLTMDAVALDVAKSILGKDAAGALSSIGKQAVSAVQGQPQMISIFDRGSDGNKNRKFDISPVWLDNSGAPNMLLNCISLDARESTRGILFWKSTKQSTIIKTGAVRAYLSLTRFADVKNELQAKYSANAKKFIGQLPDLDLDF
ncbi:hypothetical protein [Pseudomonas sp. LB3P31]